MPHADEEREEKFQELMRLKQEIDDLEDSLRKIGREPNTTLQRMCIESNIEEAQEKADSIIKEYFGFQKWWAFQDKLKIIRHGRFRGDLERNLNWAHENGVLRDPSPQEQEEYDKKQLRGRWIFALRKLYVAKNPSSEKARVIIEELRNLQRRVRENFIKYQEQKAALENQANVSTFAEFEASDDATIVFETSLGNQEGRIQKGFVMFRKMNSMITLLETLGSIQYPLRQYLNQDYPLRDNYANLPDLLREILQKRKEDESKIEMTDDVKR